MKKLMTLFGVLIFCFMCMSPLLNAHGNHTALEHEYEQIQKELGAKIKTVKTRKAYNEYLKVRKEKLTAFLAKLNKAKVSDVNQFLKGSVLMELRKFKEALVQFDALIQKNGKHKLKASFNKVQILQSQKETKKALALYQKIEDKLKPSQDVVMVLMGFAYSDLSDDIRVSYGKKIIQFAGDKPQLQSYKAYMFEMIAGMEKSKGNLKKALSILDKGIASVKGDRALRSLKSTKNQYGLIGKPAPELTAKNWMNSKAFAFKDMKGKVLVIDFWAPWCGPCRKVIPGLVESYKKNEKKGLVVLGYTKLYGRYSDDQGSKGTVAPEKEKELIEGFLKRFKISYPVAVSEDKNAFAPYFVAGIPTMVLIDKEGIVQDIIVGSGDEAKLKAKIEGMLK